MFLTIRQCSIYTHWGATKAIIHGVSRELLLVLEDAFIATVVEIMRFVDATCPLR